MANEEDCDPVPPAEVVTRFAIDKAYYRANGTAKHNAFMPDSGGGVSVFRIFGLKSEEIWEMGNREVAPMRGKPLRGRLDALTSQLASTGALICVDEPPARHALIRGFPEDPEKVMQRALDLAQAARFRPVP